MGTTRRTAAVIALLVGVVGVPVLLVAIAGWPLPARTPDWDRVATAVRQGDLPTTVVVNALACLVWICWAQFAWAVTWELAAQLRHPHDPPAEHSAPLVPRSVHLPVARLVALVLAAGIAVASTPSPALAGRPTSSTTAAPPPPPPPPVAAGSESQPARSDVWVVVPGDTVWDIATQALGDGGRSSEILELNPGVVPRRLRTGQQLILPADAAIPADRRPSSETEAPAALRASPGYLPAETITIRSGDNLWTLSEVRLDTADGPERQPSDAAVAGYLDSVIDANAIPSGNPSLIYPGERYTFPVIGTAPLDGSPAETATPANPPAPSPPNPPAPAAAPATTVPNTPPPTGDRAGLAAPPVTTTTPSPGTGDLRAQPTPTSAAEDSPDDSERIVAGIAGATVVAGGLLVAYRRRRNHAARHGAAALHRRPTPQQRHLLDTLVRSADIPLVTWAHDQLAALALSIDPRHTTGTPLVVELSTEHGLELLWDTPQPAAPPPGKPTTSGGRGASPTTPTSPSPTSQHRPHCRA